MIEDLLYEIDLDAYPIPTISVGWYKFYLKYGTLAGSRALKEQVEGSDVDIIISVEDLAAQELELLRSGDEDLAYQSLNGEYEMSWASLKIKHEDRIINLIVCLDDNSKAMWDFAAKSTKLAKDLFPQAFTGKREFRVQMYDTFFRIGGKLQDGISFGETEETSKPLPKPRQLY